MNVALVVQGDAGEGGTDLRQALQLHHQLVVPVLQVLVEQQQLGHILPGAAAPCIDIMLQIDCSDLKPLLSSSLQSWTSRVRLELRELTFWSRPVIVAISLSRLAFF